MEDFEKIKFELAEAVVDLTKAAIAQAKEKGIEPEMLNAIRENVKFLLKYLDGEC